jgi:hypothetical protein
MFESSRIFRLVVVVLVALILTAITLGGQRA